LRIALVSFEGLAGGGIATYVRGAAHMLAAAGHEVEVFTSGPAVHHHEEEGVCWHTVSTSEAEFASAIVPVFAAAHEARPFELIEGPEYKTGASGVAAAYPEAPLVVKLHGPTFTIDASNARLVGPMARARFFAGGLRRGRPNKDPWTYHPANDPERAHTLQADEIVANSEATAERVAAAWGIEEGRISVVPLMFEPGPDFLAIEPDTRTGVVLFLGRLEARKGVLDLARAIPLVLAKRPDVRFRFVGRSLPHPEDGRPMVEHMKRHIRGHEAAVEFADAVPHTDVPRELSHADICVFPSDWEASGFVCLEAMAAARGVIGSSAGGMAELIEHGGTGLLAPARNPAGVAAAILELITDPSRRIAMGRAAREAAVKLAAPSRILPLQEASYRRAIMRAQARVASTGYKARI
jgi:glycogen synthase